MPEQQIPEDERTALLIAMSELKGQVSQALAQTTDHSERIRAIERWIDRASGRNTVLVVIAAAVVSVVAGVIQNALGG